MARKQEDKSSRRRSPSDGRYARYCVIILLVGLVVLSWLSLLTYNPADPPSTSIYADSRPVHNAVGTVGAYIAYVLLYWIGGGAYMALLFATVAIAVMLVGARISDLPWRMTGLALLIVATSAGVYLKNPSAAGYWSSGSAGVLGDNAGYFLMLKLHRIGAWLIVVMAFCAGLMLTADNLVLRLPALGKKVWAARPKLRSIAAIFPTPAPTTARVGGVPSSPRAAAAVPANRGKPIESRLPADKPGAVRFVESKTSSPAPDAAKGPAKGRLASVWDKIKSFGKPASQQAPAALAKASAAPTAQPAAPVAKSQSPAVQPAKPNQQNATPIAQSPAAQGSTVAPAAIAPRVTIPPAQAVMIPTFRTAPERPADPRPAAAAKGGEFVLPSVDLLAPPTGGYLESQEEQAEQKRAVLQQTLTDFSVQAQVVGHQTGPVITLFELSLAPGVKVAQINNLATDIARSLAVPGVRVVSPIPGKDTVGIEVPNMVKEIVRIRELMNMAPEADRKMHLPLYLGKDASGKPIVADLAGMPHMLIAGTTGSGKSVCINSIIVSLLMTRTPQEVKLILVDPKMVEMAAFENVPHLLCPIVNDMRKAEDILEWAATKMDERYELLREANVKNIAGYNKLGKDELFKRFEVDPANADELKHIPLKLPYYVIIIDELADLIMTSSKEVEGHIIRIAQKARAVGIHLILATQRPSVNVVTGLIKSNMPCRVSFRVASRQESRIVLDQNGADVLLGQGDMLFLQPGTSNLARAQGAYVDDTEIRQVVAAVRSSGEPQFETELTRMGASIEGDESGQRDELFDQGVEIVLQSQRGSVSLLQRRLQVGYSRASRIIDQMADAGLLGDYKGSQARECLITLQDWQAMKASIVADQSGKSAANGEPTSS